MEPNPRQSDTPEPDGYVRFICWHCMVEFHREGHHEDADTFRLHGVNNDLCDDCGGLMVCVSESVEETVYEAG